MKKTAILMIIFSSCQYNEQRSKMNSKIDNDNKKSITKETEKNHIIDNKSSTDNNHNNDFDELLKELNDNKSVSETEYKVKQNVIKNQELLLNIVGNEISSEERKKIENNLNQVDQSNRESFLKDRYTKELVKIHNSQIEAKEQYNKQNFGLAVQFNYFLEKKDKEIFNLKSTITKLEKRKTDRINTLIKCNQELENKISYIDSEWTNKMNQIISEKNSIKEETSKLKLKYEQNKNNYRHIQQLLDEKNSQNKDLTEQIMEKDQVLQEIKLECNAYIVQIKELKKDYSDLFYENKGLRDKIIRKNFKLSDLTESDNNKLKLIKDISSTFTESYKYLNIYSDLLKAGEKLKNYKNKDLTIKNLLPKLQAIEKKLTKSLSQMSDNNTESQNNRYRFGFFSY